MNNLLSSRPARSSIVLTATLALITVSLVAGPPGEESAQETTANETIAKKKPQPPTVDEARQRARILQTVYESSLHMMHHYYFDDDQRLQIPAKSLEDIFKITDSEYGTETHWISVSAPPMNVDNKPDTAFEKEAARLLRKGQEEYEQVADGKYYRAGAITLRATCLHCHVSALSEDVGLPPVAAVVTVIPVEEK